MKTHARKSKPTICEYVRLAVFGFDCFGFVNRKFQYYRSQIK